LSGGEAQRVALARTLILGRSLVLLDEPASATDISGVQLAENYIRTVNKGDGSTIVFSTHNPSQAAHVADEVIMMFRGKIVEKGSPSKVFDSPEEQETKDFLQHWRI
jgi:ABC-type phosphate transport system ATPase subunit